MAHYLQTARATHRLRAQRTADHINEKRAGKGVGSVGAHESTDVDAPTEPIGSYGVVTDRDGRVRGRE